MKPKTKTKEVDRWKAVRNGLIFCAPACGCNCTHAKFMEATSEANRVAKLLGPGWKTRVHENCGWHFDVISPCRRLRVSGPYAMLRKSDGFSAGLGAKNDVGSRYTGHGKTPQKAIANVLAKAKADLAKIGAVLQGF